MQSSTTSWLVLTPVYGVVEGGGTKVPTLQLQPGDVLASDREMRRRVGQKAWDGIHDRGWPLCVEMGHVAKPGDTVH